MSHGTSANYHVTLARREPPVIAAPTQNLSERSQHVLFDVEEHKFTNTPRVNLSNISTGETVWITKLSQFSH